MAAATAPTPQALPQPKIGSSFPIFAVGLVVGLVVGLFLGVVVVPNAEHLMQTVSPTPSPKARQQVGPAPKREDAPVMTPPADEPPAELPANPERKPGDPAPPAQPADTKPNG